MSRRIDPITWGLVAFAVGLGGLILSAGSAAAAPASKAARPAGPPPPLPPGWERFGGARPEPRGWPENTILAVPGLDKLSAQARAALLDLAADTGIPVDSIAATLSHESGLNPRALYSAPDNAERRAAGRAEFYAAGLTQLTPGAHLPGFESPAAVRAIADMSAEQQLRDVVGPLWRANTRAKGAHPGIALMSNFLPAHAGRPETFVLGDRDAQGDDDAAKRLRAIYSQNRGLDSNHDGKITVGDVYESAARTARNAKARLTITGERIDLGPVTEGAASASSTSSAAAAPPSRAPVPSPSPPPVPPAPLFSSPAAPPAPAPPVPPAPLFSASPAPGPASVAWPPAPLNLGDRAGGLLLAAVRAGAHEPPTWVEVPWEGSHQTGPLKLTLRVATHALRAAIPLAGGQTQLVRLPVSYRDALEICKLQGWVPPTQTQSDAIWRAAKHLTARPLGEWGTPQQSADSSRKMRSIEWCLLHNRHCDEQIGSDVGSLWRDDGKDWILHPRIAEHASGHGAVNYGFRRPDGTPWQPAGGAHDDEWYDYSQTFLPISRKARDASGAEVDLIELLRNIPKPMPAAVLQPFL